MNQSSLQSSLQSFLQSHLISRGRGLTHRFLSRRLAPLTMSLLIGSVGGSIGIPAVSQAAESEPLDLDPHHQALVAREKIKQRGATRRSDARQGLQQNGQDSGCGRVDIGNNTNDSRSARGRVNPRDTTVIVTGPVINAARCR